MDAPKQRDPHPDLTEQLRQVANRETSEEASQREKEITFTSEWEILLSTPRGQAAWQRYREQMPHIKALELLQHEPHPNGTRYTYRAITASGNRLITFVLTPDFQIAALGTAPD